jgi:hypothetical protein
MKPLKTSVMGWIGLVLIAMTAAFLGRWSSIQKIGQPGVKVGSTVVHVRTGGAGSVPEVFATNGVLLPDEVLNYRSEEIPFDPSVVMTLPKDTVYGQRGYMAPDNFWIQQTVVLMGADRTSIHKPEFCLEGAGLHIYSAESVRIPMLRPVAYELPLRKMLVRGDRVNPATGKVETMEGVYLFWFVSEDKLTSEHRERIWWMAKDLVTRGELQRWAYVIAFSICKPGETEPTYRRMVRFLTAAVPDFQLVPSEASPRVATR